MHTVGYREPAARASGVVRLGPFRRKWRGLAVLPVTWLFFVVFVVAAGETVALECTDGACQVQTAYLWVFATETHEFRADQIEHTNAHSNRNGTRVRLYPRDGETIEFELGALFGGSDHEAIAAYVDQPVGTLHISSNPSGLLLVVFAIGLGLMGAVLVGLLRMPTWIEVHARHDHLEVVERWPTHAKTRRLPLDRPTEVRVLERRARTFWDGDVPGALLQIVDAGERVRALTLRPMPDPERHRAAAQALRQALGLAPGGFEEE